MHHGMKTYLDGRNFLAPLDNPQTILDIGYGTQFTFLTPGVSKYNILMHYHCCPLSLL
jgi:hypothetical protein